jgi:hypothetical protein
VVPTFLSKRRHELGGYDRLPNFATTGSASEIGDE